MACCSAPLVFALQTCPDEHFKNLDMTHAAAFAEFICNSCTHCFSGLVLRCAELRSSNLSTMIDVLPCFFSLQQHTLKNLSETHQPR